MKITSKNVTPTYASRGSKETEYQVNGIMIARASSFIMAGRFNAGKIGRTFYWNHPNLETIFSEKYRNNLDKFNWKSPELVYGRGGTIPFSKVKEIINSIA